MPSQMIFFRKNWADYERGYTTVTDSENTGLGANLLDRSNRTAWGTTDSVDANNTQITVDMIDIGTIDTVLLLKHNFKNFLLEYWDDIGLAWVTIQNVANNTASSSRFSFAAIQTSKFRITIYGTQTANADKYLYQFIATSTIGQLNGWPVIKKPTLSRNLVEQKVISGKSFLLTNVGFYAVELSVSNWKDSSDLAIVEALYNASEGFLFWPCGGDETQFSSVRQGYRMEDIFLVRCKDEFSPEWARGVYTTGQKVDISLVEVIT